MSDRRTFLKGLFASITVTPVFVAVGRITEKAIVVPVRKAYYFFWPKPMLNSGAWDARYKTYDEAKEASDALMRKIMGGSHE